MENKNVKSLKFDGRVHLENEDRRILRYEIKFDGDKTTIVSINLPLRDRPVKTDEIILANESFVNGFKIVKTKNGEYGYIREEDNSLLPYRYDIALDFNEYGLAMVGKNGYVTWINKNFEYLAPNGEMATEQEEFPFIAWNKINAFSKGEIPLSLIVKRWYDVDAYCYMDTFGRLKNFIRYSKEIDLNHCSKNNTFSASTSFNEQGYANSGIYILNSKGYFMDIRDLIKMCFSNGAVDAIFDDIDKKYEEQNRTLKR